MLLYCFFGSGESDADCLSSHDSLICEWWYVVRCRLLW